MKTDIYQTVTDSIVAMLEAGVKPYLREIARDKDTEKVANIWRNIRLGALFAVLGVAIVLVTLG